VSSFTLPERNFRADVGTQADVSGFGPPVLTTPVVFPSGWSDPGEMHWRLYDSSLGTLDLLCDNGYVVTSYDLGSGEIREVVYPNALDKGTQDLTRWFGNRAISLDITLKPHPGTGPSSGWIASESYLRDQLMAYMTPMIRPRILFTEHQDTRVKTAIMRGNGASVVVEKENYNKMTVSWVIPTGVYTSYLDHCYTFGFSTETADSHTINIFQAGSGRSHWRAYLRGEAAKPRFILDGQEVLSLDYDANPGDEIDIDSTTRSVVINGQATGYRYIPDESEWFLIPPGTHQLTIEHDTYTTAGYPAAFWQDYVVDSKWADPPFTPGSAPPPWAWTTRRDPSSGEPGDFEVSFCFGDTYL